MLLFDLHVALSVSGLLNTACVVGPRFKSMPFLDKDERQQLHNSLCMDVMLHEMNLETMVW